MSTAVPTDLIGAITQDGYAFRAGSDVIASLPEGADLDAFVANWDTLGPDEYLQGDKVFRHRRYGQLGFVPIAGAIRLLPAGAYFQSEEINAYAGGIQRVFPPLTEAFVADPVFQHLVRSSFSVSEVERQFMDQEWTVDIHLFRLTAEGPEPTHPTPEGVLRDGFPMGALHMVRRQRIQGGVSHIYSMGQELVATSNLEDLLDTFYCYDDRVMHSATPIYATTQEPGHRDVLVYGFHLPGTKYARD
ncbi:2OG-Fe dioxygenase family protein [Serpens gallinarum]|uniref:2OG-Fe dioxygenase family protein n=1 Tax=Serpens gallinarum TaxID=2763075 RepID=A0ABR8TTK2_9PSED|nr:2OG-Fe dioxygenase family protein [Serpens gallinarum]MBD7979096.1 2OG-Fe dioxygenase family protein [Serpens gallinarum]